MKGLKIEYISVSELKTYVNNAKIHTAEQIEQIKRSIEEFGFNDPIAVWKNNEIIEGHGRLIAALEMGIEQVPIIRLDDLSEAERRAYMLVHNKLTMDTGFDFDLLVMEIEDIAINLEEFGFEFEDDDESALSNVEYDTEDFGDEKFKYECSNCGFRFNA